MRSYHSTSGTAAFNTRTHAPNARRSSSTSESACWSTFSRSARTMQPTTPRTTTITSTRCRKYSPLLRSQDGYRRRRRIELCPSLYSAHDNPRRDAVQGMPSADILSHACFSLHFLPSSPRVWTDECRHSRDSWTPSSQTRPSSTTRPRPSNGQPPSLTPLPPPPTTARTSCGRPEADAVRAPSELNVEPAWVQFKGGLLYIMAAGATLQGSETYKT